MLKAIYQLLDIFHKNRCKKRRHVWREKQLTSGRVIYCKYCPAKYLMPDKINARQD